MSITKSKYFKSGQFAEDDSLSFFAKSHYQVQQGLFDAVFLVGLLEEDRYIGKMAEQSAFVSAYHQAIKQAKNLLLDRLRIPKVLKYKFKCGS